MTRPTRKCILIAAGGLPLALLPVLEPALWVIWLAATALFLLACGVDLIMAMPARRMRVKLQCPSAIPIGAGGRIEVELDAAGWRTRTLTRVHCDVEGDVEIPEDISLDVGSSTPATGFIKLAPRRRGVLHLSATWLSWEGPLGLFEKIRELKESQQISVLPNVQAVRQAALRVASHHTVLHGVKQQSFIGDGSEFEALREYMPGFDVRSIDWKASARHRKLLCRENRAERNHNLILAVDTGHLMREPVEGMPRLDHGINTALMLAYVSLRMGDQVGMLGFDEAIHGYCEPQAGVRAIHRLMSQTANWKYSGVETNYTLALAELSQRLRRRAVVVVITDFRDTITAELMVQNVQRLARRHLVIFVSIRDPDLHDIANSEPASLLQLNRTVIAQEMMRDRQLVLQKLRRMGVFCIDGPPRLLSTALVNRYLDIHRRELV